MGCQDRRRGHGKLLWGDRVQDNTKTWSRRRAEHAALKTLPPVSNNGQVPESAIYISSEDSGSENSDILPDLDDSFQDLGTTSSVGDPLRLGPKKFLMMGSPRGSQTMEKRKRKDRISQEMQAGSVPVGQQEYKVFTFPHAQSADLSLVKSCGPSSDGRSIRNKFSGVRCLQDLVTVPSAMDKLCSDFVKMQTSCLDDLLDDLSDPVHLSNCMDLMEDFCCRRKPHPMLLDKIMHNGFFKAVGEDMPVRTYFFVLKLWQRFPDLIKIDLQSILMSGDVLQKHLQNSMYSSANSGSLSSRQRDDAVPGKPRIKQCRLYFQLIVQGLQLSLSQCTLADQKSVNKSVAFACLSSEGSKPLMKKLIHWLEFCLVVTHQDHVVMAKMWMCQLQTLLDMSVSVSRDRQEAAKKLAPELKRTYKYLTDLSTKKRLLQSFSCPLLCLYVLRLVMEDQCESTIVSSQFPATIQEIIHNYYVALPPHDHLTPPPSPSDEGYEVAHGWSQMYSVQSCEELAMLVYFITKSFIACKQRRLHCDLRQQMLKAASLQVLTSQQRHHFQRSVQDLGAHLRALCSELSPATLTYLSLLDCLCLTL